MMSFRRGAWDPGTQNPITFLVETGSRQECLSWLRGPPRGPPNGPTTLKDRLKTAENAIRMAAKVKRRIEDREVV
eukprot:1296508-Pyramimonas_sp.AAC.1